MFWCSPSSSAPPSFIRMDGQRIRKDKTLVWCSTSSSVPYHSPFGIERERERELWYSSFDEVELERWGADSMDTNITNTNKQNTRRYKITLSHKDTISKVQVHNTRHNTQREELESFYFSVSLSCHKIS